MDRFDVTVKRFFSFIQHRSRGKRQYWGWILEIYGERSSNLLGWYGRMQLWKFGTSNYFEVLGAPVGFFSFRHSAPQ